jgi:hypothetical protein
MADTFDPFDLPSSFDPLGYEDPVPPRRRRASSGAQPEAAAVPAERTVNPRLAHLLPPAEPALRPHPSPRGTGGAGTDGAATDIGARLAALKDEVAILEARLTSLEPLLAHKQAVHQDRLLEAVATLIDGRLGRR